MRLTYALVAILLLQLTNAEEDNAWSWGDKTKEQISKLTGEVIDQASADLEIGDVAASASEYSEDVVQLNTTEVDKVVDDILVSTRQGRALEGFDEVYSDPTVQEALQKGDEGQARNLIKDRLCFLGLMQCDGGEDIQGKRPSYIAPEELVYAQPVAINPVGRPIPTIPLKGIRGGSGYGPPKPLPYPGGPPPSKFGPPSKYPPGPIFSPNKPPRRGYGPLPKPHYPPHHGDIYEGPEYLSKPPSFSNGDFASKPQGGFLGELDVPYEFDQGAHQSAHHKDKRVEVVVNAHGGSAQAGGGNGAAASSGVQQHVHHHFHHGSEGVKSPAVLVNPISVASAAVATATQSSVGFGGSYLQSQGSNTNSFFKPSSSYTPISTGGYGGGSSGLTIGGSGFGGSSYGGQHTANYGGHSPGLTSFAVKPIQENYGAQSFGSNSFGASVGSYGSTGLYKKELNLGSNAINSNYLQSSYADKYQGLESARAENYDCVCVPYDQCPSHDIIGRKDDLYLALDPRNLKSDIQAEEERVITDGNGTMTVVRVPKDATLNATEVEKVQAEEVKKVSKREAPLQNTQAANKDADKAKVEARQYGSLNNKKVKPTFGVSFGLPQQGGGGYPINPYGPNPHINPYGGSIGQSGINLGLVSVNPLVSIQVTKDDYGEKIVKPFINLHVTPNNYLVHKFEDILAYKKGVIFNNHKHFHYHKNKPHYYHHPPPHYYHHPGPEIEYGHHEPHHELHGPHHDLHGPHHELHHNPHHEFHPGPHDFHHGPPAPHYSGPGEYEGFGHGPPGPLDEGPSYGHHSHSAPDDGSYQDHKPSYYDDPLNYGGPGGHYDEQFYGRAYANETNYVNGNSLSQQYQQQYNDGQNNYGGGNRDQNNVGFNYEQTNQNNFEQLNSGQQNYINNLGTGGGYEQGSSDRLGVNTNSRGGKSLSTVSNPIKFPSNRKRRDLTEDQTVTKASKRQAHYGGNFGRPSTCGPRHVCCKRPLRPNVPTGVNRQCGTRHSQGINGRIKNPVYVDGDSEFGEYPWQVAILKKDPKESVYVCGGTLIDPLHIITAAHCVKTYTGFDLRVRLGEWDVNHDVEFYPYIERDVVSVNVHPEFYAGTLYNDIAIIRMDKPVDWSKHPHISPACLPHPQDDYTGSRCWTTGWGKDAFGDFGKYQNILKEVDVPIVGHGQCQRQLQQTRLGYEFKLHPGFVCAGGEEGKDACKGDGGGPMVCERGGTWQVVGVVSWGIGCGQHGVPGVYVNVAHYLDWIRQVTQRY